MTFLTRKTLTRRTMLKGMGASVALPLLDSMMPALSAQTTASRQAPIQARITSALIPWLRLEERLNPRWGMTLLAIARKET